MSSKLEMMGCHMDKRFQIGSLGRRNSKANEEHEQMTSPVQFQKQSFTLKEVEGEKANRDMMKTTA